MEEKNKVEFSGTVERITYKNDSNGYTVLTLSNGSEDITATGILPFVTEGEYIRCTGEYVLHPTYGEQLKVDYFEPIIKEDSASILKYLSSGAIKGIGPATARKIVQEFGKESLDIIENFPEKLVVIKGLTYEKALSISEFYKNQFGMREIMLKLSAFNITPNEALKVFRKLGAEALQKIEQNPYILCEEGIAFPFDRVEEIAEFYKIPAHSAARVLAGVTFVLSRNAVNSHTCLPHDKLCAVAAELLEVEQYMVEEAIDSAVATMRLISEEIGGKRFIFLPEYYKSERYSAARIKVLEDYAEKLFKLDELEIDNVESKHLIKFAPLQREAIMAANDNGVFILTGGPGTGKTTTLSAIIDIFEQRGLKIVLAAPTGRAARRITELTGLPAKTVHRLLEAEYVGEDDIRQTFARNEKNPLDCDVLVLDEMSMVDTFLLEGVLRALRVGARLIMVGDANQLPSVGAGNVLSDLLEFSGVPNVCLKTIFRQAESSLIVTNAHKIVGGEYPEFPNSKEGDCFFLRTDSTEASVAEIVRLVTERLPKAYGFLSKDDIQVLCPSKKFATGSTNLNAVLQNVLNPKTRKNEDMNFKGGYIRTGDKVMQIKNNYDIIWETSGGETGSGVFNGDIGYVTKVEKRFNSVTVDFEGKSVTYSGEELGQLELAYAITVHKSQGSEFECVVMPLYDVPSKLCYRNLLYTAVTRAKKLLVLVGEPSTLCRMVDNDRKTLRYTGFGHFLKRNYEYN